MVIILCLGLLYIHNVVEQSKPSLSVPSIILSTLGFGGLIYGINNIGNPSKILMVLPFVVALVSLVAFAQLQFRLKEPMLDLKPFTYPIFTLGVILIFMMHMVNFSIMLMLPILMQGAMGIAAFTAGLIMLPGGVINGICSPLAGIIYDKHGPNMLILPGFILSTIVFLILSRVVSETLAIPVLIALHCLSLVAVAIINTPCQTHCLNQLPADLYPHGNAISNTIQQVGGAFGTAFFIALMSVGQGRFLAQATAQTAQTEGLALAAGVRFSLGIAVIVLVVAVILSLLMNFIKSEGKGSFDYEGDLKN